MQPQLREFDDIQAMRTNLLARVKAAVIAKYPIENSRYSLELEDVEYDTEEPPTIEAQKKAIFQGKSLRRKLSGNWILRDKATGRVVDQKRSVVTHVPDVTNRGTFIYNGSEYTVANQMRLRPGVYTRRKESGELEAHFNLLPGTGKSFRVHMEPETGVFKMQVGQSHIPLYSVLRSQGVTDAQLQKKWGVDLLNANRAKADDKAVGKAYERLARQQLPDETPAQGLGREMRGMELDSEIVANNLGDWFDKGDGDELTI